MGSPIRVSGQQPVQHGARRLRHDRMQQRGRSDHQHAGRLGAVGRVEAQAEVAVRYPTGLQDLTLDVDAELLHCLCSWWWWMAGAPGYPAGPPPSLGRTLPQAQPAGRSRARAVAAYRSTSTWDSSCS
jgi:hypothetical protein